MRKSSPTAIAGSIVMIILLAYIMPNCESPGTADRQWGAAKNLGPHINSAAKDEHATFTPDGQTMVFASTRGGGFGAYDLYVSHLKNGKWTKAELLPFPINTERDDFDPFIAPDGKMLFFASNRDNSDKYWDCDIYVSLWNGEEWGEPEIFDPVFVTPGKPDWGVTVTKDFKTFIFSSGRGLDKVHSVQIFQSLRLGKEWSAPALLPFPVNTGEWEATPYITPDGKALYLNSIRGWPDKKDVDIWRFELKQGKWTNHRLMDGPFLSDRHDYDPCLGPDGKKFYFTSDREDGFGDSDIYMAEKIRK